MTEEFWNAVKGHVANMLSQMGQPRMGRVTNVDPARALVRVSYDEEGTISGWLPIAQLGAGGGMSVVCLPTPGTQVFVAPDMGSQEHGVVLGAVHSTQARPGQVTPYGGDGQVPLVPGEPTIMGPNGQYIRLTQAGNIEMHGPLRVDGNITTTGNMTTGSGATGTFRSVDGKVISVRNGVIVSIV